jgi:hypothetical protein
MNIRYDTSLNIIPHVLKKQSQQARAVTTAVKAQADVAPSEKAVFMANHAKQEELCRLLFDLNQNIL